MTNVLASDAVLKGILASLRRMREICARFTNEDADAGLTKSAQEELDILKKDISRLSNLIVGVEFLVISDPDEKLGGLENIDESIEKISRMRETLQEPGNDEKLTCWMKSALGN
jgi:hypothetical protein